MRVDWLSKHDGSYPRATSSGTLLQLFLQQIRGIDINNHFDIAMNF